MADDHRTPLSEPRPAGEHEHAPVPLSIVALDDDADFRQFLSMQLSQDGHDVRALGTPEELFASIEARLPDVVLLDMHMGRTTGAAVLGEVRKRWARLCVIVVTGYPSMDSMRQTFKQDVFDYIAKPFSIDELRRVLAQAAGALNLGGRAEVRLRAELGRTVRLARMQRGWTLKELSDATGISSSQLSSVERGGHLASLESLLAIAGALGAKPSAWLEGAGF
ncbi:MAG: response regulator [bacterium]